MAAVITMAVLGIFFGGVLALSAKYLKVEEDPRVEKIAEILPQANCGACGYPGCSGFAKAVVSGEAPVTGCLPGGKEVAKKIAEILGVEAGAIEEKVAFVFCSGGDRAKDKNRYAGIESCTAAKALGGTKACYFACYGLGDCVEACPFDAIHIVDGRAVVDFEKCTGCGACVKACPQGIIELIPRSKAVVFVACSSCDSGAIARKYCANPCIGCKMCERVCPTGAIKVEGNLARIDYEKCIGCGACAAVCPTKVIRFDGVHKVAKINDDCVGCTLCAKVCPVKAITGEVKEKHEVDPDKCVGCTKCVEKCPKNAIEMVEKQ